IFNQLEKLQWKDINGRYQYNKNSDIHKQECQLIYQQLTSNKLLSLYNFTPETLLRRINQTIINRDSSAQIRIEKYNKKNCIVICDDENNGEGEEHINGTDEDEDDDD
ncbi:unnamed protein product, partial [Didymodactylos carnosus]